MNKFEILALLHPYIQQKTTIDPSQIFTNVTSNLEGANKEDIVLYRLTSGEKSDHVFRQRLKLSNDCLLIINKVVAGLENRSNTIVVENAYWTIVENKLVEKLYPLRYSDLKIIGVTGTNGKTTVVNFARQIAAQWGYKSASLGTLGYVDSSGSTTHISSNTTPSYVDLCKILFFCSREHDIIFMEVSSHSLTQNRLREIKMDCCAWTNLSQDHLDYHKTMEGYYQAKKILIESHLKECGCCFIPSAQSHLYKRLKDTFGNKICMSKSLKERGVTTLPFHLNFSFNQANLELAQSLCEAVLKKESMPVDYTCIFPPEGRCAVFQRRNAVIVVDYAHTPEALENICQALRSQYNGLKLTVVFGCGGDRDATKRPKMGAIVRANADRVVITMDNPRFESQDKITQDILSGIGDLTNVTVIESRKDAIYFALEQMKYSGVLLIAGKGHEDYQDIMGVKHAYSDIAIVNNLLKEDVL